jgi:uncharacterized protein (DUF1778 family)
MAKKKTAAPSKLEERIELRLPDDEKHAFQQAAAKQRISLSLWLRLAALKVIKEHDGRVQLLELQQ